MKCFTRWEAGYNSVSSATAPARELDNSFTRWEAGYNSVRIRRIRRKSFVAWFHSLGSWL